jgi:hypothetical protein
MFDKKIQGINFIQIKKINTIEKFLIDILKWSCILDLKLLIKSYNGK